MRVTGETLITCLWWLPSSDTHPGDITLEVLPSGLSYWTHSPEVLLQVPFSMKVLQYSGSLLQGTQEVLRQPYTPPGYTQLARPSVYMYVHVYTYIYMYVRKCVAFLCTYAYRPINVCVCLWVLLSIVGRVSFNQTLSINQ